MSSTIVFYYSLEGNSAFAAKTLAESLGAPIEQLHVSKEPPKSGLKKFLVGGSSALRGKDPGLFPIQSDLSAFDNVVLVFPIWAGTYPPAVGAFLSAYDLSGKSVYAVACSASGNADKSFEQLRTKLGADTVKTSLSLIDPLKKQDETSARIRAFSREVGA